MTGIVHWLCKISWLLTALASLNIGLAAAGMFDFFTLEFVMSAPALKQVIQYAVGLSGAWSLFGIVRHLMYCGSGKCECM